MRCEGRGPYIFTHAHRKRHNERERERERERDRDRDRDRDRQTERETERERFSCITFNRRLALYPNETLLWTLVILSVHDSYPE